MSTSNETLRLSDNEKSTTLPEQDVLVPADDIVVRAKQVALHTPEGFFAFGFGSGLLTRAPGTMGTLAAIPPALLIVLLDFSWFWVITLSFLSGIWFCQKASYKLGLEDYGGIVWDEMVGYWLVVSMLPFQWGWWLAAFVLFRVFDILKPWPISLIEEWFDGGLGIMLDDILAAVYTLIVLSFIENLMVGI